MYDAEGLMMTAAVSAGYLTIDVAYDIPAMAETLDFIQGRFHKGCPKCGAKNQMRVHTSAKRWAPGCVNAAGRARQNW